MERTSPLVSAVIFMPWGRLQQTGPAASGCPIQLIQAGPLAAAISQESNQAPDRAGGLLSMEL